MNMTGPVTGATTGAALRQQAGGGALSVARPGSVSHSGSVTSSGSSVNDPAAIDTASADPAASAQKAQLREAAKAFEAIFMRQMISSMRTATPGDTLFGNDAANQFRDMADARLADDMAKGSGGGFGIAEMLLKQFGVSDD
jgi:flagellar protein FlgJ